MKTLQDILAELQAVETTELDKVVAQVSATVTDLQEVIANPVAPVVDAVVSVEVTTASGVKTVFSPSPAPTSSQA